MCKKNKLIIAAAGSGKTTLLVKKALKNKDGNILITTYTDENEKEIHKKFYKENGCVPKNVTIQTWFSFLIKHGVKPFQASSGFDIMIKGLCLIEGCSPITRESAKEHYFTKEGKIYSDKLSKLAIKCNEKSSGAVIDRISKIYTDIYIDEAQDLAGHDLDFVVLLISSNSNVLLVCDPRQKTYVTNNSRKNIGYKSKSIKEFLSKKKCVVEIDEESLNGNYRCNQRICDLSDRLYPEYKKTVSENFEKKEHDGVFLVSKKDLPAYLNKYEPMQLRWDKNVTINESYDYLNFGASKGATFDRVLIYPTQPMLKWLKNNPDELAPTARAKFYVAITRARYSVAIVCDEDLKIEGLERWHDQKNEEENIHKQELF